MSIHLLLNAMNSVLADPAGEYGEAGRRVTQLLERAGWLSSGTHGCGHVIGVDLGGTKLLAALARADGTILVEIEQQTRQAEPANQVAEVIAQLLQEAQLTSAQVAQVVVGVPGAVAADGHVMQSPHVQFSALPFAQTMASMTDLPVIAENDANIAAFGEYAARPERMGSHLAFVSLGTGIGMGLIVDGTLLRGAHGAAGEISGMPFGGLPAAGHAEFTYEARVSTQGIRRRLGHGNTSVRAIFDAAEAGDAEARQAMEGTLDDLSIGLATIVSLVDPGLIVLGGGIGSRPGLAEAVARRLSGMIATPCQVEVSRLAARAGLLGALAYARHRARRDLLERLDELAGAAA